MSKIFLGFILGIIITELIHLFISIPISVEVKLLPSPSTTYYYIEDFTRSDDDAKD